MLQAKANDYLTEMGGKQVALNQIDLGGATLSIALPGADHPRALPAAAGIQSKDPNCAGGADFLHFCAYHGANFTGDNLDIFVCDSYDMGDFGAGGSWDNNQSTGTRARMFNRAGTVIFTTAPAHSSDKSGDWSVVHTVKNC